MDCGEIINIKPKKKKKLSLEMNRYGRSRKMKDVSELNAKRFQRAFGDQKIETRMQVMSVKPHPGKMKRPKKESWEMTWKEAIALLRSSSAVYKD